MKRRFRHFRLRKVYLSKVTVMKFHFLERHFGEGSQLKVAVLKLCLKQKVIVQGKLHSHQLTIIKSGISKSYSIDFSAAQITLKELTICKLHTIKIEIDKITIFEGAGFVLTNFKGFSCKLNVLKRLIVCDGFH